MNSLPGAAEAAERSALVFGRRRQEEVEAGKDGGAVDDILVGGKGNYATDCRTIAWFGGTMSDEMRF
jgi:hypothetical protein